MKFTVHGELPSMNEIIAESKKHYGKYSEMKRTYTDVVFYSCYKFQKVENKVNLKFKWFCKNKKKDKDNIMAGQKFVIDGMVKAKIIKNDGWNKIGTISHEFEIDKNNVRVEVEIEEVKL